MGGISVVISLFGLHKRPEPMSSGVIMFGRYGSGQNLRGEAGNRLFFLQVAVKC